MRLYIEKMAQAARFETAILANASIAQKSLSLMEAANAVDEDIQDILAANEVDLSNARANGIGEGKLDRLKLTEERMAQISDGIRQVAKLPDPIGEVLESWERKDGLSFEKIRVPVGVIAMVYEARPNVTVDAASLAIKTGNAVILRGGKEAIQSNTAMVAAFRKGLLRAGLPSGLIQFIDRTEHESVDVLIRAKGLIDLVIPRGGAALINHVTENAHIPVIETGVGNCHVYVDEYADSAMAIDIVTNAKVQRPSVCNAVETLLVHEKIADSWLPSMVTQLVDCGVEVRVCPQAQKALQKRDFTILPVGHGAYGLVCEASEQDYATEFLDYIIAVKVVSSLDEVLSHIDHYGTRHSESIVTENRDRAEQFLRSVDAAAVYHNASTRFTDGFEFGFGAEIGISTQKLHARGPMGLKELTSYKYVIRGQGQVRG